MKEEVGAVAVARGVTEAVEKRFNDCLVSPRTISAWDQNLQHQVSSAEESSPDVILFKNAASVYFRCAVLFLQHPFSPSVSLQAPVAKVSPPAVKEEAAPPASPAPAKEEPAAPAPAASPPAAAAAATATATPEPGPPQAAAAAATPDRAAEIAAQLKNLEPHLGPVRRAHNRVLNPPGGKSSVAFY